MVDSWKILKETLKEMVPNILTIIMLIVLIRFIKPSFFWLIAILLCFQIIASLIAIKIRKKKFELYKFTKNVIIMIAIITAVRYGLRWLYIKYGLLGFVIFIFVWASYRMIRGNLLKYIRRFEIVWYGKLYNNEKGLANVRAKYSTKKKLSLDPLIKLIAVPLGYFLILRSYFVRL